MSAGLITHVCSASRTGINRLVCVITGSLAAVILMPWMASALCRTQDPAPSPDSVPAYAAALVESLSLVKRGATQSAIRYDDDWSGILSQIRRADEDYRCAAALVRVFMRSDDEFVAKGAAAVSDTYRSVHKADKALAHVLLAVINDTKTGRRIDDEAFADRFATHRSALDEAWKQLPVSVATATHGLVRYTFTGRPSAGLRLTWEERAELQAGLLRAFGPSIRDGHRGAQVPLDAAAGLLYGFLGDSKWRSATSE